jgi:hypothetical protein
MPNDFVLTPDQMAQIEGWRVEEQEYLGTIAAAQDLLAEVRRKLDAAAILTGQAVGPRPAPEPVRPTRDDAPNPSNMIEAIARIVESSDQPISRKNLRKMLATQGFPDDRLANYFYTAVARLKAKGRLEVLPDGSLTSGLLS